MAVEPGGQHGQCTLGPGEWLTSPFHGLQWENSSISGLCGRGRGGAPDHPEISPAEQTLRVSREAAAAAIVFPEPTQESPARTRLKEELERKH